jgi:hypothetical protein
VDVPTNFSSFRILVCLTSSFLVVPFFRLSCPCPTQYIQPATHRINRISAAFSRLSTVLLRVHVSLSHFRPWQSHGFVEFYVFNSRNMNTLSEVCAIIGKMSRRFPILERDTCLKTYREKPGRTHRTVCRVIPYKFIIYVAVNETYEKETILLYILLTRIQRYLKAQNSSYFPILCICLSI